MTAARSEPQILRDAWGVPHVIAEHPDDAWFGLGFAAAADRMWQMEWDRRRATGRWSELAGPIAVAADCLARRLRLEESARSDVNAMSAGTRSMFESYAAGVNAYLLLGSLPPEYAATSSKPEPWEAWHSVASFKIRHVLMGTWQLKLAHARLLAMIGPERYREIDRRSHATLVPIVGAHGVSPELLEQATDDLASAARDLGFLGASGGGSNSWAVHGSRTVLGAPIICNDSHRFLDVPNVYWQARATCSAFSVAGAMFPGVPGFPHFGHTAHVTWNITHAMADYQDLYVEQFDPEIPGRYRVPGGWATAERRTATVTVRGGPDVEIETWKTRHGPVVHGDPTSGSALALRYTGTDGPCRTFEVLPRMVEARSVEELLDAQRDWVDPVNNLVCADASGNIGYLTRGAVPIRASQRHRRFPAPGWTGENEWIGMVPFDDLPRVVNPPEGFIATANQPILATDAPYIADSYAEPYRAERIVQLLRRSDPIDATYAASMQADVTSTAAQRWIRFLGTHDALDGDAESARAMLLGWDGSLEAHSPAALLYGYFRRAVAVELFEPVIGEKAWSWLTTSASPANQQILARWLGRVVAGLELGDPPRRGATWSAVLQAALSSAWESASDIGGADPNLWRWDLAHVARPRHPLADSMSSISAGYDPPPFGLGGDGDTIRCAEYDIREAAQFDVTALSVYRQVVDLGDPEQASWAIPGGSSGNPESHHYLDQLPLWEAMDRIPMNPHPDTGS